jgi:hypothetical protein
MFARTLSRSLIVALFVTLLGAVPVLGGAAASPPPAVQAALSCTFTAQYRAVNLRSGAGTEFDIVGTISTGETLAVIDQAAGSDGFVWWKSADGWVRSDMGTSDCPSTCGNTVCEYGENSTSCAQDCGSTATSATSSTTSTTTSTTTSVANLQSTGEGCYVSDCQSCYESVSCWPTCNVCDCWKNAFGCVTCFCQEPTASTSTATGCEFATCADCIAAFPCSGGPCANTECSLNQYGCPVCTTSG